MTVMQLFVVTDYQRLIFDSFKLQGCW